jgi:hypothetical protein
MTNQAAQAARFIIAPITPACTHQNNTGDTDKNKCCYPPMPMPNCPSGQDRGVRRTRTIAASTVCNHTTCIPNLSFDSWFDGSIRADINLSISDKNNDYCQNTGWGGTWCQPPQDYPQKTCSDKQKYCADKQECECPAPMWWDDKEKKCKWQPMPKPSCPILQSPYCGKSKEEWCAYSKLRSSYVEFLGNKKS